MSLNVKVQVVVLLSVAGLLTGCSGINASKSISPATFLLPGLLQAEPMPEKTNDLPVMPTPHGQGQDSTPS